MKIKNRISLLIFSAIISLIFFGCNQSSNQDLPVNTNTTLCITNSTSDSVLAYITLGNIGDTDYVQSTVGIFGITNGSSQNSFWLAPNDTLYYTSPTGKGLDGNITFGTPPVNCPDTVMYPNGINLFEFALNDNFLINAQETVDISCISGVNCIIGSSFSGGGSWTNGADTITSIQNSKLYDNIGLSGVFPFGCDSCIGITSHTPYCAGHKQYATPQKTKICNIQRNAINNGGNVIIEFNGFVK